MRLESTCAVRAAHKKIIIIVGEGHEITMVFAREVSMKIVFKFQMVLNDSFNLRMRFKSYLMMRIFGHKYIYSFI